MHTIFIAHNFKRESYNFMSYELAHYLAAKGWMVVFLSHNPRLENVKKIKYNKGEINVYSWLSPRPTTFSDFLWFSKLYKQYRPDIILGHFVGANILAVGSKFMSLGKVKSLVYYHSLSKPLALDNPKKTFKAKFRFFRKKLFYNFFVDLIITPSKMGEDDFIRYYGLDKCQVLLNPIEDRFKGFSFHSKNELILGFLGRLDKSKGILGFIENFISYKLNNTDSILKLKIAGPGYLTEHIRKLALQYDFLQFEGSLNYEEIDDFISKSSFIVIPSISDNLTTVGLEALMNGVPIVISSGSGLSEYISDKKEGFKFNYGKEEIIEVFERLEHSSQYRNRMAVEARKTYLKLFSIEEYCDKMYQLLK